MVDATVTRKDHLIYVQGLSNLQSWEKATEKELTQTQKTELNFRKDYHLQFQEDGHRRKFSARKNIRIFIVFHVTTPQQQLIFAIIYVDRPTN